MQKNLMCKILVLGIIVLFIGAGIHPVFAVNDKTSISENENLINIDGEILENNNCFVMGISSQSVNYGDNRPFRRGIIIFGFSYIGGVMYQAEGWIYTSNIVNKWAYNGYFSGALEKIWGYWNYEFAGFFYIGIKGFRGLAFVDQGSNFPKDSIVMYIGFAESVRIKVDEG